MHALRCRVHIYIDIYFEQYAYKAFEIAML